MAEPLTQDDPRLWALLEVLEHLVTGDYAKRAQLSERHDVVDALSHGVNVLAGEVGLLTARLTHARDDAQRTSDGKEQQLRTLSHELRTPLASLLALLDLAEQGDASPERRQALLARARVNAQLLVRLADDLLDISRIEAGILNVEPEPCLPGQIARDVVESLRPEARRKGLAIELAGLADGDPLMLDPARLLQILMNLVANAVKYTERGQITVTVARTAESLTIEVGDTGIGIPAETRLSLFLPFARQDSGVGGHGLGLYISRRIAEAMAGSVILVQSTPGHGSTFRATFPAIPAPKAARTALPFANVRLAGLRVLLGEDDPDLGETMLDLLSLAGAEVSWEKDGRSICTRADAEPFDLLVLDLGLPHLDGLEVIRRLRAAGNTTPAAALTADAFPETRARCLAAGFDAHVAKGLPARALCERLASLRVVGKGD